MPDSFGTLSVETRAGVVHITLNRPELRNAMSLAMVDELMAALQTAEGSGARAIVLRGAGGHFCSGGDIKDMGAAQGAPGADGVDPAARVNARFGHLCKAYAETGLPVVVVLDGAVMGGGFGLACVADVALARETALFRLPETGLGLVPAQIAPFLVERLGYSQARRLAVKVNGADGRLFAVGRFGDGRSGRQRAVGRRRADAGIRLQPGQPVDQPGAAGGRILAAQGRHLRDAEPGIFGGNRRLSLGCDGIDFSNNRLLLL
jgi:hypothetical protein